jgi:hypothetical protein
VDNSAIPLAPTQAKHHATTCLGSPTCTPPTAIANPVLDHATGKTLEHRQLRKHPAYKQVWDQSYGNELGRLCQGIGSIQSTSTSPSKKRVEGTNTMRPIMFHKIPHDRLKDVAHVCVVCDVKLGKEDPN